MGTGGGTSTPSERGVTSSAHAVDDASGSGAMPTSETISSSKMRVSEKAALALAASPYSERQVRRRASRTPRSASKSRGPRRNAHPRVVDDPSLAKSSDEIAADCGTNKEQVVVETTTASTPTCATPSTTTRVTPQSPALHAKRPNSHTHASLVSPLPRVVNTILHDDDETIEETIDEIDATFGSATSISMSPASPPRPAPPSQFGDPSPGGSLPVAHAATALVRAITEFTRWKAESTFNDVSAQTPVRRAAAAMGALSFKREAMARRMAMAERAYGQTVTAAVWKRTPKHSQGTVPRIGKSEVGEKNALDSETSEVVPTPVPVKTQTPAAAPGDSRMGKQSQFGAESYAGGSASVKRAARLANTTPHQHVREFRDFKRAEGCFELKVNSREVGLRKVSRARNAETAEKEDALVSLSAASPVPGSQRVGNAASGSVNETTPTLLPSKKQKQSATDTETEKVITALRDVAARRRRERGARREGTRSSRGTQKASGQKPRGVGSFENYKHVPISLAQMTPTEVISFAFAKRAYGVEPARMPETVAVRARSGEKKTDTNKTNETPDPHSSSWHESHARRAEETHSVYSASSRRVSKTLRSVRFETVTKETSPSLARRFKPRPPRARFEEGSSDDTVAPRFAFLPPRPKRRQWVRATRIENNRKTTRNPAVATPPPIRETVPWTEQPLCDTKVTANERKRKASALERTTWRLKEAAARRERLREARREKAKAFATPGEKFGNALSSQNVSGGASPRAMKTQLSVDKALKTQLSVDTVTRLRAPQPASRRRRERESLAASSPFASARRLPRQRASFVTERAAVDDVVDRLIDDLVADERGDRDTETPRALRAERRRRRERDREDLIHAPRRANARKAREAARQNAQQKTSQPEPKPKVVATTRADVVAKRLERRRRVETSRKTHFASVTRSRPDAEKTSAEVLRFPQEKRSQASQRVASLFHAELTRIPRGVSAFDWEVARLPPGSSAASRRARDAYSGISALKSSLKKKERVPRSEITPRRSKQLVLDTQPGNTSPPAAEVDVEYVDDFELDAEDVARALFADAQCKREETNAVVTVALNGFIDDVSREIIETIQAVDCVIALLVTKEVAVETANARSLAGALVKAKAAEAAKEAERVEAVRFAAAVAEKERAIKFAEETARRARKTTTGKVIDFIIDSVLVGGAVRIAENEAMARRIKALRLEHEIMRRRLGWDKKLECTPRAVLRKTTYSKEDALIIRGIEPGIAIRVEKGEPTVLDQFDPFGKPDLSWMEVCDAEDNGDASDGRVDVANTKKVDKRSGARLSVPISGNGTFMWEPVRIELGHDALARRLDVAYGVRGSQEKERKSHARKRVALVKKLVAGILERVVLQNLPTTTADPITVTRAVTPETIELTLDIRDATNGTHVVLTKVDAAPAEGTARAFDSEDSDGGEDFFGIVDEPKTEKKFAKSPKSRRAFTIRPASPVSPLTPSLVKLSPLCVSLRGVRKSLL